MPRLNRDVIRSWLEDHNWSIKRLAEECSALGDDTIPEGTMRNAVNGIDPMRSARIKLICKITAIYGDGISYRRLASRHNVPPGSGAPIITGREVG
jgi:hypothetical protein